MNVFIKWGVLLLFTISFVQLSYSNHIVGGEIFYDSIGVNQYRITIELYRDCNSTTNFDTPLGYTVFLADGTVYATYTVNYSSIDPLVVTPDPCIVVPTDICIERAIYIDTIILPFNTTGYNVSYQRCCWAPDILNITDPENNGLTLTTFIPGSNTVAQMNHCARFMQLPPLVLCSNRTIDVDYSAIDPNSDSLVYELVSPFSGGDPVNTVPSPETAPPYSFLAWNSGYTPTQPFGTGSSVILDPLTGMMEITPQNEGEFIAGVSAKEYRNGVLINTETRIFAFRVVLCDITLPYNLEVVGNNTMIENCNSTVFNITRSDTTFEAVFQVFFGGSAIKDVDYQFPDSIVMPINVDTVSIPVVTLLDNLPEGTESVEINIIYPNLCNNTLDTSFVTLYITDYKSMNLVQGDTAYVCDEQDLIGQLSVSVSDGLPGYVYDWESGNYPDNDTLKISTQNLQPGSNLYTVTVTDQCQKTIQSSPMIILNECPLVTPNVITANGDNINDLFVIKNLDDYESVELILTNRWGNVVYQNSHYQNDWSGLDMNGEKLSPGTYFYTVTPKSNKYNYYKEEKTKYTARGFVEIIH